MFKSALLHKRSVNETAAIMTAQKYQLPYVKRQDASLRGLPSLFGGGDMLSVTPLLISDDHGVFPAIQVVSKEGGACILDPHAFEDLVVAYSKLKPLLEEIYQDLRLQGLVL